MCCIVTIYRIFIAGSIVNRLHVFMVFKVAYLYAPSCVPWRRKF